MSSDARDYSVPHGIERPTWDGDLLHLNFWLNMFLIFVYIIRSIVGPRVLKWGGIGLESDLPKSTSSSEEGQLLLKQDRIQRVTYMKCTFYLVEIAALTIVVVLSVVLDLWSIVLHPSRFDLRAATSSSTPDEEDYRKMQIGFVAIWNILIMVHFLEILFLEDNLRWELKVHHWALIILGNINYWAIVDDPTNVYLYRLIFAFTIYETTELPTYVALLLYRMKSLAKRIPNLLFWMTAIWYGISRIVVFALIWKLWNDYRRSLWLEEEEEGTRTMTWSYITLGLDSTANAVAFVTGMVAWKAQISMARKQAAHHPNPSATNIDHHHRTQSDEEQTNSNNNHTDACSSDIEQVCDDSTSRDRDP